MMTNVVRIKIRTILTITIRYRRWWRIWYYINIKKKKSIIYLFTMSWAAIAYNWHAIQLSSERPTNVWPPKQWSDHFRFLMFSWALPLCDRASLLFEFLFLCVISSFLHGKCSVVDRALSDPLFSAEKNKHRQACDDVYHSMRWEL